MKELVDNIKSTIELIESAAGLFYQQKRQEGLQQLELVIGSITDTAQRIVSYQAEMQVVLMEEIVFNAVLTEALKSLEQKDFILLADILVFEINGLFYDCLNQL